MSYAYLPEASRQTRLDASEAFPNVPFDMAQKIVYPSIYPLPGSSHPPLASAPNPTFPTSSSFAPSTYSAGGVYYAQNYHDHSTIYPPAAFIPPAKNTTLPMNNTTFLEAQYPYQDMGVGSATSTATTLPSEGTCHYEQPAPLTFQYPPPTQHEATLDQLQVQHHWQAVQEGLAAGEPSQDLGEVPIKDDQTTHAALVASEVCLFSDQLNNQAPPPEENTTVHTCSSNPNTACLGRGVICLDILSAFVSEYPDVLSPEQIAKLVIASLASPEPNAGQLGGQPSQVNATDPPSSQHRPMGWGTASSGLNTTASTSTSAHSSPSGFIYPPNHFAAESSSMGSTSRSAVKRQLSDDYLEDYPDTQRGEGYMDVHGDLEDHRESGNIEGGEKQRKKKKKRSSDEGEYICRLCLILGRPCRPLSRKDALKRHIALVHAMFTVLFGHENFDILKPRRNNAGEDLGALKAVCITVQVQARQLGVEIKPEEDLALLHPHVAASLDLS